MKIKGIYPRTDQLARLRDSRRSIEQISIRPSLVDKYIDAGWKVIAFGRSKVRMQRERSSIDTVKLQSWRVMYLCGFPHISGEQGAQYTTSASENYLDIIAYDDDSVILVECRTSENRTSSLNIQAELIKLGAHRDSVRKILNTDRSKENKLKVGGILVLYDIPITEADKKRAAEMKLTIFDATTLQYYERLAGVIGTAARYQLFGEVFQGQDISSLTLRLPAVEFEMGGNKAYSFAIHPEDLLKISFVAHRGKGNIETYQRMVSKKRLKDISNFINEDGVFPTNIVINFQRQGDRSRLRFDTANQENSTIGVGSRLGHLTIPPVYQAAWVIDGQHRLLAYSDHRWASRAMLTVTAFDGLGADKQADLFEKINSKQKKVSANLLVELFSTLHWNSRDPKLQLRAIASQLAQELRSSVSSPLYTRVLSPDEKSTLSRCITLTELVHGLQRPGMFVRTEDHGVIRQYGVFWTGSSDGSFHRAKVIISAWFESIRDSCPEMWSKGNDENLGLVATNRGINASLRVLGWVLLYLRKLQPDFDIEPDQEIIYKIHPFSQLIGQFFTSLTVDDIRSLRKHYGTGAPAEIAYSIGKFIKDTYLDFDADGLTDWIDNKSRINVTEAQTLCTSLERRLIANIVKVMKNEYGEEGWWRQVPLKIRQEAASRREEESEDHPLETFLYLIDLRNIIDKNWGLFQNLYSIGSGSKEAKTKWLVTFNEIRRKADHAGGARLKSEDIDNLKLFDEILQERGI